MPKKFKVDKATIRIVHLADSDALTALQNNCNHEASGDSALMVDTDALDNGMHPVCGAVRAAAGKNYTGLVWVVA